MKKILITFLVLLSLFSLCVSAKEYDDMTDNKYANAVNMLSELGVIGGYEDGTFKPDHRVTRAEMAKLVYVLYTTFYDAGGGESQFDDVEDTHWAKGYINWCYYRGIVSGTKFRPNDNITYDEALQMVLGALGYTNFDEDLYPTDVRMKGLLDLNLGEKLDGVKGSDEITRDQISQLIYNSLTADMNETKTEYVYSIDPSGNKIRVPIEVAKALATDVWYCVESIYVVTGTETLGDDATGEKDVISLNGTMYELSDIGLDDYIGETDSLFGKEVCLIVSTTEKTVLASYVYREDVEAEKPVKFTGFDDVAGHKHAYAINTVSALGIMVGREDGTFRPDQRVTRAEMARALYVLKTTSTEAGEVTSRVFTDVPKNHWAAGFIKWCSNSGIIGGYGDGTFGPDDNVTYDQALKMVCVLLGYKDFESMLWPTDVRMKALRELNLGTNLDDLKGSEYITRGELAEILYNALSADMKETKIVYVSIGDIGVMVPMEVAKTLAVDVWGYEEALYTVTGSENFGADATHKKDVISLNGTDYYLTDLGLDKYEGKTDALIGVEIVLQKRNLNNSYDGEVFGTFVIGSVIDGVEVKYNKAQTILNVNGESYTADDDIDFWILDDTITVKEIFDADKTISQYIIDFLDEFYMARIIDSDGDSRADHLVIDLRKFYKAKYILNGKVTVNEIINGRVSSTDETLTLDALSETVKKNDVVAIANLGGILYTDVLKCVETYGTKLNASSNKLTLSGLGEFYFDDGVLDTPTAGNLLGISNTAYYYVYEDEIILRENITTTLTTKDVTARLGKTFKLPVYIENNEGLTGLSLKISYPEGFTLENVEKVDEGLSTLDMTTGNDLTANPFTVAFDGVNADSTNGQLLILTFKAGQSVSEGDYNISVDVIGAYDDNLDPVEAKGTTSTVSVKDFTVGDTNDDGEIDLRDVIILRRFMVGGYGIEENPAFDTDNNGEIDLRDVIRLRRYIVGGYGVTLE